MAGGLPRFPLSLRHRTITTMRVTRAAKKKTRYLEVSMDCYLGGQRRLGSVQKWEASYLVSRALAALQAEKNGSVGIGGIRG